MTQQTIVQKSGRRLKILDRLLKDRDDVAESEKDLEFLTEDYIVFSNLAAALSSHSKWIPYPFLIDRLKRVADELRGHADLFRAKILDLGGQLPPDVFRASLKSDDQNDSSSAIESRISSRQAKQNVKGLVNDMEEHSSRCEILQHQMNKVNNSNVVKLIGLIIVDMQRQKEELLDIVMRIS